MFRLLVGFGVFALVTAWFGVYCLLGFGFWFELSVVGFWVCLYLGVVFVICVLR